MPKLKLFKGGVKKARKAKKKVESWLNKTTKEDTLEPTHHHVKTVPLRPAAPEMVSHDVEGEEHSLEIDEKAENGDHEEAHPSSAPASVGGCSSGLERRPSFHQRHNAQSSADRVLALAQEVKRQSDEWFCPKCDVFQKLPTAALCSQCTRANLRGKRDSLERTHMKHDSKKPVRGKTLAEAKGHASRPSRELETQDAKQEDKPEFEFEFEFDPDVMSDEPAPADHREEEAAGDEEKAEVLTETRQRGVSTVLAAPFEARHSVTEKKKPAPASTWPCRGVSGTLSVGPYQGARRSVTDVGGEEEERKEAMEETKERESTPDDEPEEATHEHVKRSPRRRRRRRPRHLRVSVIFVGGPGVGKSALIDKYLNGFSAEYVPTSGIRSTTTRLSAVGVKAKLTEVGGKTDLEAPEALELVSGAQFVVFVFAVNNLMTLLLAWRRFQQMQEADADFTTILVGTFCDKIPDDTHAVEEAALPARVVARWMEARALVFCSNEDGTNVDALFQLIRAEALVEAPPRAVTERTGKPHNALLELELEPEPEPEPESESESESEEKETPLEAPNRPPSPYFLREVKRPVELAHPLSLLMTGLALFDADSPTAKGHLDALVDEAAIKQKRMIRGNAHSFDLGG